MSKEEKKLSKNEENYENWKNNYIRYISYYFIPDDFFYEKQESLEDLKKEIKKVFETKNENKKKKSAWELSERLIDKMLSYSPKDRENTIKTCISIALKKNKDYGSDNILDYGLTGLLVRNSDKLSRLINLEKIKTASVEESIEDTQRDIINYAVYMQMLCENCWY